MPDGPVDEGFVRRTGGPDWLPYWEAGRRRELRSLASEWAMASGRARLLSWVVCHPPVLPAWKERTPYAVVLVECEEGVRTMGNLVGAGPEVLRMDMAMVVDFAPSPDGDLVPQWRPGG